MLWLARVVRLLLLSRAQSRLRLQLGKASTTGVRSPLLAVCCTCAAMTSKKLRCWQLFEVGRARLALQGVVCLRLGGDWLHSVVFALCAGLSHVTGLLEVHTQWVLACLVFFLVILSVLSLWLSRASLRKRILYKRTCWILALVLAGVDVRTGLGVRV